MIPHAVHVRDLREATWSYAENMFSLQFGTHGASFVRLPLIATCITSFISVSTTGKKKSSR